MLPLPYQRRMPSFLFSSSTSPTFAIALTVLRYIGLGRTPLRHITSSYSLSTFRLHPQQYSHQLLLLPSSNHRLLPVTRPTHDLDVRYIGFDRRYHGLADRSVSVRSLSPFRSPIDEYCSAIYLIFGSFSPFALRLLYVSMLSQFISHSTPSRSRYLSVFVLR